MRVVLSGGGTGGHIYPAVTIARAIESVATPCDVLFIGTKQGLEADIVPKEGFAFETVHVQGLERRLSWKNVRTVAGLFGSLVHSRRILRRFKPDVVIGTGGYVCGPVLLTAALMGIPTMIQEQNVIPGITNKILTRFVTKVALGYADAAAYFSGYRDKLEFTGNPIRNDVILARPEEARQELGLDSGKKTVLISGGSRGARSINRAMVEAYSHFIGRNDIQLLHVTGQSEYNDIVGMLQQRGIDLADGGNIIIKPYLYNMPQALAAADIAIFRAGAIGLAELTARGIPAILVPYPYAAENHQEFNAKAMEKRGAAVVVADAELPDFPLAELIDRLLGDPGRLAGMAAASKELGCPDAAKTIAGLALELVRHTPSGRGIH